MLGDATDAAAAVKGSVRPYPLCPGTLWEKDICTSKIHKLEDYILKNIQDYYMYSFVLKVYFFSSKL